MDFDAPVPWKPAPFMVKAAGWLAARRAAALLFDPGMRKTSTTLAAFCALKKRGLAKKALVVAPLRPCYLVWPAEAKKWVEFRHLRVGVAHGPRKEEVFHDDSLDVVVVNPDGLPWLTGLKGGRVDQRRVTALGADVLVVDELSAFKNSATKRFRVMKQLIPRFTRRWGLTGSPAANGLMGMFGQCYVLDGGRALGKFVTHYRMKYFHLAHPGSFEWVLNEGAEEEIYRAVAPPALRAAAEDYVQMPAQTDVVVRVDLPPAAREAYDSMEGELVALLEKDVVVAATAGVAANKCRQIASGGVYVEQETMGRHPGERTAQGSRGIDRQWRELHTAKLDALEELVGEMNGQQLLVAYEFQHDLERVLGRLGPDTPVLGGGVSMKRSAEVEAAWNRGEIPVLLAHPAAAGHGLNLQGSGANHVCWFTLTWDYELYDQLNRRVRRSGSSAQRVFVHHLVARNTVDEAVLGSLRAKERGQKAMFSALLRARRGRKL